MIDSIAVQNGCCQFRKWECISVKENCDTLWGTRLLLGASVGCGWRLVYRGNLRWNCYLEMAAQCGFCINQKLISQSFQLVVCQMRFRNDSCSLCFFYLFRDVHSAVSEVLTHSFRSSESKQGEWTWGQSEVTCDAFAGENSSVHNL